MNVQSIILLLLVLGLAAWALHLHHRSGRSGGCHGSCNGCSGCPSGSTRCPASHKPRRQHSHPTRLQASVKQPTEPHPQHPTDGEKSL